MPLVRDLSAQALMARGRVHIGEHATWGAGHGDLATRLIQFTGSMSQGLR